MSWRQGLLLAGIFVTAALLLVVVLLRMPDGVVWAVFGLFCAYQIGFWERERRGKRKDG